MKRLFHIIACTAFGCSAAAIGGFDWMHVVKNDMSVVTNPIENIDSITFIIQPISIAPDVSAYSTVTTDSTDSTGPAFDRMLLSYHDSADSIRMDQIQSISFGRNIPSIHIDIKDSLEVVEKALYLDATFTLRGNGYIDDIDSTAVAIKGRGNSTWGLPKKPYRLKFKKKQTIGGLRKAKSYVLLANYLDGTLMHNAVALKTASLMGMPFTDNCVPVDLYINGSYRGSYTINEKAGINSGSVDIDEMTGMMWELDTNFDEEFQYYTPVYQLPAMVKDPDLNEIVAADPELGSTEEYFSSWQEDLNALEKAVAERDPDLDRYLDINSLVDYLMVYNFCRCHEVAHPKSMYLYKEKRDTVYHFGPVWDFDWAFTYDGYTLGNVIEHYSSDLVVSDYHKGQKFLLAILGRKDFMDLYRSRWEYFKTEVYPEVMRFIDDYSSAIRISALRNGQLWPEGEIPDITISSSSRFDDNVALLKEFLVKRMDYLDHSPNLGLYIPGLIPEDADEGNDVENGDGDEDEGEGEDGKNPSALDIRRMDIADDEPAEDPGEEPLTAAYRSIHLIGKSGDTEATINLRADTRITFEGDMIRLRSGSTDLLLPVGDIDGILTDEVRYPENGDNGDPDDDLTSGKEDMTVMTRQRVQIYTIDGIYVRTVILEPGQSLDLSGLPRKPLVIRSTPERMP